MVFQSTAQLEENNPSISNLHALYTTGDIFTEYLNNALKA